MKKGKTFRIIPLLIALAVITVFTLPAMIVSAEAGDPSDVKNSKPVIKVERTANKKAVITCSNSDGYGMKVYRATKKDGNYKLIKKTKKSTYTDKTLKASKVYYYKVKLYAKGESKTYFSKFSKVKKAKKYVKPPMEKPVITSVKTVGKGSGKDRFVRVTWKRYKSYTEDTVSFYVYRKEAGGSFMLIDGVTVWKSDVIYLTDNSAKAGKTYVYKVWAGSKKQDYTCESLDSEEYTVE